MIIVLQALFSFAFLFMPGLFINSSMLRNICDCFNCILLHFSQSGRFNRYTVSQLGSHISHIFQSLSRHRPHSRIQKEVCAATETVRPRSTILRWYFQNYEKGLTSERQNACREYAFNCHSAILEAFANNHPCEMNVREHWNKFCFITPSSACGMHFERSFNSITTKLYVSGHNSFIQFPSSRGSHFKSE